MGQNRGFGPAERGQRETPGQGHDPNKCTLQPAQKRLGRDAERRPAVSRYRPGPQRRVGPGPPGEASEGQLAAEGPSAGDEVQGSRSPRSRHPPSVPRGEPPRAIRERRKSIRACYGSAGWKTNRSFRSLHPVVDVSRTLGAPKERGIADRAVGEGSAPGSEHAELGGRGRRRDGTKRPDRRREPAWRLTAPSPQPAWPGRRRRPSRSTSTRER
jgi:hypothetical protein